MKKIFLMMGIYFLSSTVSNATTTITVKGAGGLHSDGTNHKVCPIKDPAECAKITLPPSISLGSTPPSGITVKIETKEGIVEGTIVKWGELRKERTGYVLEDNKLVVTLKK